jgi:hypothetical protein
LRLVDPLGQVREEVFYTDRYPWPETADGAGDSLQRVIMNGDPSDPATWVAAPPTPGAPARVTTVNAVGDVVITEVHYHPADKNPADTFIELLNRSAAPIDLINWCITGLNYCIGAATPVRSGDTVVLRGVADFDPSALSRRSARLVLMDQDGVVQDVIRYRDRGQWPALADGHGDSLHRRDPEQSGEEPGNWESQPPSPGVANMVAGAGLLPVFTELAFTRAPAPGVPIRISGVASGVNPSTGPGTVFLRIGFEEEIALDLALSDIDDRPELTRVEAVIGPDLLPAEPGTLVRFRLEASGPGGVGLWPRAGDGARYHGTVIAEDGADPSASELPVFQWFMPDDEYRSVRDAVRLHGNDGYPTVIAFRGEVFDNTIVRIKGNQARTNTKRKWKFMLPAGHEWDGDGLLVSPVDQFDLLPAATDKSFSREILTAEVQAIDGGWAQQVFPMRIERNGRFYGLYMYGESLEGKWRSERGFSDATLAYKGERNARFRVEHHAISPNEFRQLYERYTLRWADDNDQVLRDFIYTISNLDAAEQFAFALQHTDVAQIIDALAKMQIVQHLEWQHKNFFVLFDPADERWRLVPIDFDLTFGRVYLSECRARCDQLSVYDTLNYPSQNRFAGIYLRNPTLRAMYLRRVRTLADEVLTGDFLERRMAELLRTMGPDADRDNLAWPVYGQRQNMQQGQQVLIEQFLVRKRRVLFAQGVLPPPQPAEVQLDVRIIAQDDRGRVVRATIGNPSSEAIDISAWQITEIGALMPAGAVIPAGGMIEVVFRREPVGVLPNPTIVIQASRSG